MFLDGLQCDGSELTLQECVSQSSHNCDHLEDAGVRCESKFLHSVTLHVPLCVYLSCCDDCSKCCRLTLLICICRCVY